MKLAGQRNPSVLQNHYLDTMCTIDGSAIFLGTCPRTDLTQDFRSATMERNAQLPQTLPSEAKTELERTPKYASLTKELERLGRQVGLSNKSTRNQVYKERRKLEDDALKRYQQSRVRAYPTKVQEHEQHDWRKGHFDRVRHMKPELNRLSRILSLRVHLRSPDGIAALKDLIALRRSDCRVAYQQALQPINGRCPVLSCRQEMIQ